MVFIIGQVHDKIWITLNLGIPIGFNNTDAILAMGEWTKQYKDKIIRGINFIRTRFIFIPRIVIQYLKQITIFVWILGLVLIEEAVKLFFKETDFLGLLCELYVW